MSKRIIALILAALLCGAASLAETREGIIYKEGEPEPIFETRWDSALGFSLWYDAEALAVEDDPSEDGGSVILSLLDDDLPVYLEIMTPERVGVLPWKFLELNAPADVEYWTEETEQGGEVRCFGKPADHDAHIVECYYAVEDGEDFVVAVSAMPEDAVEGWGKVFDRIVCSISFAPPAPVCADWCDSIEEADGELLVVDQDGAYVALTANQAVTDFALLSLELTGVDGDGNAAFDCEALCERDELAPGQTLVLKLAFPGDMPCYGISYTDAEGVFRRCTLEISGMDGSLGLWAF